MTKPQRLPTTERLAVALELAGAPIRMIELARSGQYDDYQSDVAMPISLLIFDARAAGLPNIAERAMDGEFDATSEEADEWAASQEGQETFRALLDKE